MNKLFIITILLIAISANCFGQTNSKKPWCSGNSELFVVASLQKYCLDSTLEEVQNIRSISARLEVTELRAEELKFFTNLKEVHLMLPEVTQIDAEFFSRLNKLENIELHELRKIEGLPEGLFSNLPSLKSVSLGGFFSLSNISEKLFFGNSTIENVQIEISKYAHLINFPEKIFNPLVNLTKLDLRLESVKSLPSNIFKNNTKLIDLNVGASFENLPSDLFSSQTNLKSLIVTGFSSTQIELPDFFLRNCKELTTLNLRVIFSSLPTNFFNGAVSLHEVDLSFANGDLHEQLRPLTELRIFNFKQYYFNKEISLASDIFLNNKKIKEINLSGEITTLPHGLFSNLPELEYVDVKANRLKEIQSNLFENSPKVKGVGISGYTASVELPQGILEHQTNLEALSIIKLNSQIDLRQLLMDKPRIRYLNFCWNKISSFPLEYLASWGKTFESLDLSSNPISIDEQDQIRQAIGKKFYYTQYCN